MKFNISEVSKLLGVSETTIQRWIRHGKIPVKKIDGEFVFSRWELAKWAHSYKIINDEAIENRPQTMDETMRLSQIMRQGGVFFNVSGNDMQSVLQEAVALCPLPDSIDSEDLFQQLLQREELASTGVGKGIAIPHPYEPMEDDLTRPIISTYFLKNEIEFHTVDGKPVSVLFLLLSPSMKIHFRLLSLLSYYLLDDRFIYFLKNCHSDITLFQRIEGIEMRFG